MSTVLSLIVDNLDCYEHFIIIIRSKIDFFVCLLVSKKKPKVYLVPNVLSKCPRGPVDSNVFIVSTECISSVESCVIHDDFAIPFAILVQLSPPFRYLLSPWIEKMIRYFIHTEMVRFISRTSVL